jgi:hypothetical protein
MDYRLLEYLSHKYVGMLYNCSIIPIPILGLCSVYFQVIPSRASQHILQNIFEYLQWVGMKSTSALLLTESPVPIDTTLSCSAEPWLCKIFSADKKGPTE